MTRPDKHDPATLREATQAVHAGNAVDPGTGAIRTPLVLANSYALPDDPSALSWSSTDSLFYTRNGGVNQFALQHKLAALEGAEDAVVLGSGVAALHAVFFTFLSAGDHVVVADQTYEATFRLFSELLPAKYGISADFVDTSDPRAVAAAMRPTTRIVHTETIANPTTRLADVAALAAITHEAGALLTVDATFSPPPLSRPVTLGADLSVHSLTKYINGHGDAMGGSVAGATTLIDRIRNEAMVDAGGIISPFNAWLINRGSITLPLRIRQHCDNALAVARFLESDHRVAHVAYPGLASHPQHELASRVLDGGFGGMLAFALDADPDTHNRFVASLRVNTSAVSLGHDESLIVYVGTTGPRVAYYAEPFRRLGHLRCSVGLEDPADLVDDLSAALDAAFG